MAMDHAAALRGMALCRGLGGAELDAIAAIAATREIEAGRELFHEGDPGDGLFLVVSGEIDIVKRGPRDEQPLARLGEGAVLGEISLLTNEPRSATGRAVSNLRVLYLPAPAFRALLAADSPAALKMVAAIAEVLAHRVATMNAKVLELADRLDPGLPGQQEKKDKDFAELHRAMQIWSF